MVLELTNGKMEAYMKANLWMERGKERGNGQDPMAIRFKESISKISKMGGESLLGPMEKYTKASLETIYAMGKVPINILMVKLENFCG